MRSPVVAGILHWIVPGLGHFYYGKSLAAFKISAVYAALLILTYHFAYLSIWIAAAFTGVALFLHIYFLFYFVRERNTSAAPFKSKTQRRLRYMTYFASAFLFWVAMQSVRRTMTFEVPISAMEPTILSGDLVVVDRRAFQKQLPTEGEVVVVEELKSGQSSLQIRRMKSTQSDQMIVGADGYPRSI